MAVSARVEALSTGILAYGLGFRVWGPRPQETNQALLGGRVEGLGVWG